MSSTIDFVQSSNLLELSPNLSPSSGTSLGWIMCLHTRLTVCTEGVAEHTDNALCTECDKSASSSARWISREVEVRLPWLVNFIAFSPKSLVHLWNLLNKIFFRTPKEHKSVRYVKALWLFLLCYFLSYNRSNSSVQITEKKLRALSKCLENLSCSNYPKVNYWFSSYSKKLSSSVSAAIHSSRSQTKLFQL